MNPPATPIPAVPDARVDFPGWLPPMLVKELRQSLRAKGFVGLFAAFHLLAIIIFWWTIELNSASGLRDTFNWVNGVFWSLLNVVLLLIVPLRGLAGLRTEIENKTLDLLVLTRLTAWRIVIGKWVALVAQASLFLVALLPYGVVRYFFGSVDLAGDLAQLGWLFLISAVLAAVALWVSGLPKAMRVLLPVGLVIAFQTIGLAAILPRALTGSRSGSSGVGLPLLSFGWQQFFLFAVLLVAFLGLAVRRIAPPAENHSMAARLLGLLLLLGAAAAALLFGSFGASQAMGVGFAALIVVTMVEISRDCLPMSSHWRPWRGGGPARAWFGRLMLPGWPSAALFAAFTLTLLAVPTFFVTAWRPSGVTSGFAAAWWLMLAWQALVFPALLLSFLPANSSMRIGGSGYFVIQGLFGTISLLSASNSAGFITGENFARNLDALCQVLPVSSFWLGAKKIKDSHGAGNVAGQFIVLLVLIALVWRQTRLYWGTIERYNARPPDVAS